MNLLILIACLIGITSAQQQQALFSYHTILDHNNRVLLDWNIVNNISISCRLTVILTPSQRSAAPVIGLGFSDHGEFNNADFAIFEITNRQQVYVYDASTDSQGVLQRHLTTDYTLFDASVQPLRIQLFFTRSLCADPHRPSAYTIEPGTTHILHFLSFNAQINDIFNLQFAPFQHADSHDMKQTQLIKSQMFNSETSRVSRSSLRFEARVNRCAIL